MENKSCENEKKVQIKDLMLSDNPIYPNFFAKNSIVEDWCKKEFIHKTVWHQGPSENSFCLKSKYDYVGDISKIIIDRFEIKNKELFQEKYKEAVSGDGQEWTRITTLHSSSLLALLCFYNVTKEHPIVITLDGRNYTFTESFFEVKTQVYQESESNMDVVLRGEDSNKKRVVFFLESKFSEYLNTGKYDNISKAAYEETYKHLSLFDNPIENIKIEHTKIKNTKKRYTKIPDQDQEAICIKSEGSRRFPIYCGGIKQMISHFQGISHYVEKQQRALGEHASFKYQSGEEVLLGEILFDFKDIVFNNSKKKLENYQKTYTALAKRINSTNPNVRMIETPLTYQSLNLSDFIEEKNVKDFYKL